MQGVTSGASREAQLASICVSSIRNLRLTFNGPNGFNFGISIHSKFLVPAAPLASGLKTAKLGHPKVRFLSDTKWQPNRLTAARSWLSCFPPMPSAASVRGQSSGVGFSVFRNWRADSVIPDPAGSVAGLSDEAQACGKRGDYYQQTYYNAQQPARTTVVSQTSITVVVVTAAKPSLLEVPAGSSMRIKVNFLGNQSGRVFLNIGKLVMECKVLEWNPSYAVFALPDLGILDSTEATIDVTKADGLVARETRMTANLARHILIVFHRASVTGESVYRPVDNV